MVEKDIQTLKDAVWLIEKLTSHLGIDLNELEENYNNSLQELEEIISRNE